MYGAGAGQMLGYFTSGALVSVAKESGQSADTLVAQNILKMFSRMLSGSISNARWIGNSDVIPQLASLVIGNQPVWLPPNGLAGAPGGFLMGIPLRLTEHAKTLGDKGDLQLIDPRGYYAATKRAGIKMSTSIHLFFDYDIQAFKWTIRIGGQPFLSAPVSPKNGSNTKSHFVTLDERA
ncbi:MAG: phage major capsid protein, partial [Pseudomonadales bacterium]|nr:phage major capsid protein [Pseudomonadales bacterium]